MPIADCSLVILLVFSKESVSNTSYAQSTDKITSMLGIHEIRLISIKIFFNIYSSMSELWVTSMYVITQCNNTVCKWAGIFLLSFLTFPCVCNSRHTLISIVFIGASGRNLKYLVVPLVLLFYSYRRQRPVRVERMLWVLQLVKCLWWVPHLKIHCFSQGRLS